MLKNKYTVDAALTIYHVKKTLYETLKGKLGRCEIPEEDEGEVIDTLCELRKELKELNGTYGYDFK